MELYISADYGKTWYFVCDTEWGSKDNVPYEKAGYSVRVLYPLDLDCWTFRSRAIFPSSSPVVEVEELA